MLFLIFLTIIIVVLFNFFLKYKKLSKKTDIINEMSEEKKPTFILLTMNGCGYCDKMKKNWDNIKSQMNVIEMSEINLADHIDIAKKYNINSVPVIISPKETLKQGYCSESEIYNFFLENI